MTIKAEFKLDIPEIEEDYPDQKLEYISDRLRRELVDFLYHVVDGNTDSPEECDAILFGIAMQLLGSFQGKLFHTVLRKRLEARIPGLQQRSTT